jgi:TP901 family phage tail tape measure protein
MASKTTTYELQVRLGAKTSPSWKTTLKKAEQGLESVNSVANKIVAGIAAGVAAAAGTATYALSQAVDTYTEFEQEMATVQSISGANAVQFEAMEEAALSAGRSTIYTAEEAASALEYMSLAGWSVEDSISGLTPILQLAAATGAELQTTSDLVTDSMSALGIGVDDLDMYLDKLIESNNDANTSAEQLMEALVKTGGASRTLGADLDDTITALDVLANNGKKGEEAGTALNSIFVRLAGNSQAIKELGNLGVDIWDDDGNFIGLEEALIAINGAMDDLTDEDKAKSLKNIAGTHYYSQMAYLLDAVNETVDAEGNVTSAWDSLESQITDSNNALDTMYGITTDTLENAEKRLQSAVEDMQIQVVDVFSDDAKEFVGWLADKLPEATDSIVAFAEAHKGEFADALEDLGDGIVWMWDNGIAAGQWIIKNRSAIVGALKGFAVGFVAIKAALAGINIIEFFSNPLTAAIAVAGLAVTAIGAVAGAIEDAGRAAVGANLAEHFGNISLSMEETDKIARQLIGEDLITIAETLEDALSESDSTFSQMNALYETLEKDDWKIQMGFDMDEDTYKSDIQTYVDTVQQYVVDKGYAVHVATTLLDGNSSEIDIANSKYYSQLDSELTQLEQQIQNRMKYLEFQGLDIDTDKYVQEYLAAVKEIQDKVSAAENQAQLDAISLKYSLTDMDADSFTQLEADLSDYADTVSQSAREAYAAAEATLNQRLASEEGYTQEQYNQDVKTLEDEYYKQIADVNTQVGQQLVDAIQEAYPELGTAMGQYEDTLNSVIEQYLNGGIDESFWTNTEGTTWDAMASALFENIDQLIGDEDTKKALQNLQEGMDPIVETLRKEMDLMAEAGGNEEAVENIKSFLSVYDEISSLAGTNDYNILEDTGALIEQNENALDFIGNLGLNPENLFSEETAAAIEAEVYDRYQAMGEDLKTQIEDNPISAEVDVDVTAKLNYTTSVGSSLIAAGVNLGSLNSKYGTQSETSTSDKQKVIDKMYHNAAGGIYDRPIITTFAEEGPEAAVPLDGSARAKSLWMQSGEILGMFGGTSRDEAALAGMSKASNYGSTMQIEYKPNVNISGNASAEEVRQGISMGLDDLRAMLTDIQRENNRVSFA